MKMKCPSGAGILERKAEKDVLFVSVMLQFPYISSKETVTARCVLEDRL
jgi:hypothetical protein